MIDQMLHDVRLYWDKEAATFDDDPDHGLRDPVVREAWKNCLVRWLPSTPATVLDMGCGTGSLSVLLASLGYNVTGGDVSPAMLAQAEAKAQELEFGIPFHLLDAANPQLTHRQFDVVLCRHLLWSLPDPAQVLRHWVDLLKYDGRLVMIEGYWHTGGGMHAPEIVAALPPSLIDIVVENLSDQSELWGRAVADERYMVRATLPL